jgi:hypothetical protein
MERKVAIVVVCLITTLVALGIFAISNSFFTGNVVASEDYTSEFIKCLNEKGYILYGIDNSVFFEIQRDLLGEAFKNVTYVNCALNPEDCFGIVIYPSWKTQEGIIPGALSLGALSKISGCNL